MHASRPVISLSIGLAAAAALATAVTPTAAAAPPTNLVELRARGQAGLDDVLARYRAAEGAADDPAWIAAIDAVAAQRYAAESGLYWYTDLALAEAEAQRSHRPILALRMLGDLREDLSCANSRLFRTVLYANAEVSAFLRRHFVLYWSSERPVPKVTIDFGDGRVLASTITGNSAHYVLDEKGHVLDVLPGLYAPRVWIAELTRSAELARQVRGASDGDRVRAVVGYHEAALGEVDRAWQSVQDLRFVRDVNAFAAPRVAVRAQLASVGKRAMEMPVLRRTGIVTGNTVPADDTDAWAAVAVKHWGLRRAAPGEFTGVLDFVSRAFVLHLAGTGPVPVADPDDMIARLEQRTAADTALNELRLRAQIRRQIIAYPTGDFAALNGWIYDNVFATPRSDAWLGLLPRTEFTGLPGDGAQMP